VGVHTNGGCNTTGTGFNFGVRISRLLEESPTLRSIIPTLLRCGDSGSQAGFVSEIAAIRHLNQQVVTAVRTKENTLKLISWQVNANGSVSRTGDSGSQAGVASSIDIARGDRYVTACRTSSGKLKLISWDIDAGGTIQRGGDSGSQAGTASRIKIVALDEDLFVTACRDSGGNLKLITWRLNNDGSLTRRGDSGDAAGKSSEISMVVLRPDANGGQVVTSVRAADGSLKLIVWDISASGNQVTRLGDSGSQAGAATKIRSVMDPFGHVVTAVRAGNKSLKLISWNISEDGNTVTRMGDSGKQAGFIGSNALMVRPNGVLSAVRTKQGTLKLIDWALDAAGTITRQGDSGSQAGQALLVTLTQEPLAGACPFVSAVRTAESTLKLITWREA
jgi:hypothetical protein